MTYNEMLEHLSSTNIVDNECWRNICYRIGYDAASTVPGAVKMLLIIRQRVMNGECIEIPLIKTIITYDNIDRIILEHFGECILLEMRCE